MMRVQKHDVSPVRAARRAVSIQQLLEWAFQRELASLDFDEMATTSGSRPGISMEYVLMQRHNLGCQVDGGGRSEPHPDADLVASALASLPVACGGRTMAVWIAELARAGTTPDWLPGAVTRCVPMEWRKTKHGQFATTRTCGSVSYVSRGRKRSTDIRCCPVTYSPSASKIASTRRGYLLWWGALLELSTTFRIYDSLTAHVVTDVLPPRAPWSDENV